MSYLESQTGPSLGCASQTLCRSCTRQGPNYMALGAKEFSEEALTAGVNESSTSMELHICRGLRFCCSTKARREIRRRGPTKQMASYTVKAILKPRSERLRISIQQKAVAMYVRVEVWAPLAMDLRMVGRDHSGPTSTGKP